MPRAKRKSAILAPAPLTQPAETRTTDLVGLTEDGRLVLWQEAAQVRPIAAFERKGELIKDAHYVIEWKNHAITVHCASMSADTIGVQFMCGAFKPVPMPRAEVEAMLLGEVIPSDEDRRIKREIIEAMKNFARQGLDAPHRQRGRLA